MATRLLLRAYLGRAVQSMEGHRGGVLVLSIGLIAWLISVVPFAHPDHPLGGSNSTRAIANPGSGHHGSRMSPGARVDGNLHDRVLDRED